MGRWSRQELEEAYDHYQKVSLEAFRSGNFDVWADLFTEDCTYVECYFGTFGGRESVKRFIKLANGTYPTTEMKYYPVEWHIIDEDRGWVVAFVWNRMTDPGDGSIHQAPAMHLLKYAGNGKWSYEEDLYNPLQFAEMIECWEQAKEKTGVGRGAPPIEMPRTQKQAQMEGGRYP